MTHRQILTSPDDPSRTEDAADKSQSRLDLSITQVAGGALAAMTAAALGSRLGVGGTIAGAAFASIVAAVASALYTASLRSTGEKVKTVWSGPAGRQDVAATAAREDPAPPPTAAPRRSGWGPFAWRRAVLGAVAVFSLAGVLLTGYEALAGRALSGGSGTTVEQVSTNRTSGSTSTDDEEKSNQDKDEDEEPAAASPSPEPSEEPGSDPSSGPEPSSEPSSPVDAPSSEPSGGAEEPGSEPTAQAEEPEPSADAQDDANPDSGAPDVESSSGP